MRLPMPNPKSSDRISAARSLDPELFGRLITKAGPHRNLLNFVKSDSGLETFAWTQLLATGAIPYLVPPLEIGFRKHPIIDYDTLETRGDLREPTLLWECESFGALIFLQITMRTK